MKNAIKKLTIIISVFAIVLVGCSGEMTEEKIVERVLKNYKDEKTIELSVKEINKNKASGNMDAHVKLDIANFIFETNLDIMGTNSKVYIQKKDDTKFEAYINILNMKWVRTEVENKDFPFSKESISSEMMNLYEMVKKYDVFEVVKNEDNFVLKSDTQKLAKYNQLIDGVKEENIELPEKKHTVEWTIDNKDFNIIDLKIFEEGLEDVYLLFDNIKKSDVSVEIPQKIKDEAVDSGEVQDIFNNIKINPEENNQ